jgi:hypothetical protein
MPIEIKDNSLAFTTIDHDTLKQSLKNYLKNQEIFRSYDFETSNMGVLLSLLAYNTSMLAFYANMDVSESWLDSAQLRDSISSHAKTLNYLPRSVRSPIAKLKVKFDSTGENQPYVITKGSGFTTQVNQQSFQYVMPETIVVSSSNNTFEFETEVFEGTYLKDAYIFQSGVQNQRFKITNRQVDTRSITVTVFEDNSSEGINFSYATTLLGLNEKSRVFFLQPAENGYYEVIFGDGVVGKQPKTGSYIIIDYRVTEGAKSNGAKTFSINFDPTGLGELTSGISITTVTVSENGAEAESNESVRYYAPRHFQIQERAITESDYEISLKTKFPEINAVSVFGGEKVTPPKFGRVYISVDIANVDGLPPSKIEQYTSFISKRNPLGITPIFIEPRMLYWKPETKVKYNINVTDSSTQRIKTLVTDAILKFNEEFLDDFNVDLKFSRLVSTIDGADSSIVSNQTGIWLYRKTIPTIDIPHDRQIGFTQPISTNNGSVYSSNFISGGTLCQFWTEDGNLWLRNARTQRNIRVIGSIDYKTGLLTYSGLTVTSFETTDQ